MKRIYVTPNRFGYIGVAKSFDPDFKAVVSDVYDTEEECAVALRDHCLKHPEQKVTINRVGWEE